MFNYILIFLGCWFIYVGLTLQANHYTIIGLFYILFAFAKILSNEE